MTDDQQASDVATCTQYLRRHQDVKKAITAARRDNIDISGPVWMEALREMIMHNTLAPLSEPTL